GGGGARGGGSRAPAGGDRTTGNPPHSDVTGRPPAHAGASTTARLASAAAITRCRMPSAPSRRRYYPLLASARSRFDAGRANEPRSRAVKITDVTLTLFSWESIPSTTYGHHTARPTGKSDLGLLRVMTDEGIEGHAFLGTSSNPASLDGPMLIRFLKPIVMDQDPLDRERLNKLLWARARVCTVRAIGAVDIALWDIAGKKAGLPIHRLIGTSRDKIGAYASSE